MYQRRKIVLQHLRFDASVFRIVFRIFLDIKGVLKIVDWSIIFRCRTQWRQKQHERGAAQRNLQWLSWVLSLSARSILAQSYNTQNESACLILFIIEVLNLRKTLTEFNVPNLSRNFIFTLMKSKTFFNSNYWMDEGKQDTFRQSGNNINFFVRFIPKIWTLLFCCIT